MREKLILLFVCLSFSFVYKDTLAEKREKKAEGEQKTAQQESWMRLGDVPRQPDDGEYTVRQGDTLWDISNSFLKDPFKWQNLWKTNPFIINPHLIYPGNKIRLIHPEPVEAGEKTKEAAPESAGEASPVAPETLPVEKLQKPAEEAAPVAIEEKPQEAAIEAPAPPPPPVMVEEKPAPEAAPKVIKVSSPMMEKHGLISAKDTKASGVIIGAKEERLLLSKGDIVYISVAAGTEVKQGDKFTIFTTTGEIKHPVTDKPIGFLSDTLGMLEIIKAETGGVIVAKIGTSYKEIFKGARLKSYEPPVKEVVVKKAERAVDGIIIASLEGKKGSAENDVVYLDKGKNSGLEQGNVMEIFRPTTAVDDPMSKEEKIISFPPAELGRLVIIRVEEDTSAAFIIKSKQAVYTGDRVKTVE